MMQIGDCGHWFPRWDNHEECPRCRSCDPEDDPCVICDLWDAGTLRRYRRTLFYKEKLNRRVNGLINPLLVYPSDIHSHSNGMSSALASAASVLSSPTAPTIDSILPDVPTSSVEFPDRIHFNRLESWNPGSQSDGHDSDTTERSWMSDSTFTSRHQDRTVNGSDPPPSYDRVVQDDIQRGQELSNRVEALESQRQLNNMERENLILSILDGAVQHTRRAASNRQPSRGNQGMSLLERIEGRSRQCRRFSNEDFNDIGPPGQRHQRDMGFSDETNNRVHHPSVSSSGSGDDQARAAPAYAEIAQRNRHDPELPTFEEVMSNQSLYQTPLYPTAPPQHEIPWVTSWQSSYGSFLESFPSQPSAPPLYDHSTSDWVETDL